MGKKEKAVVKRENAQRSRSLPVSYLTFLVTFPLKTEETMNSFTFRLDGEAEVPRWGRNQVKVTHSQVAGGIRGLASESPVQLFPWQ